MCKTGKATRVSIPSSQSSSSSSKHNKPIPSSSFSPSFSISNTLPAAAAAAAGADDKSTSLSISSSSIRTYLRDEDPTIYPFSELSSAPTVPLSSSTSRLTLRSHDAVVFRRPFLSPNPSLLPSRLAALCRTHHRSVARLLGASLAADHIYLIYKHVPGATLDRCLHNRRNPNFTLLPTWLSRIQVISDLAQALEYIHHQSFTVHNRIKSSSIIVTEPDLRAKLCYFGAAELAWEVSVSDDAESASTRTNSRLMRIEGTRGYIAPEVLAGGRASQKSDIYAFGVVLLEILSGEEPLKYVIKERDCYSVSVVEVAREAVGQGRVREWMDQRLKDSFPAEVAEKVAKVALRCVEVEAESRPEMVWVAGKLSRLFLDSEAWMEKLVVPKDFSVSFAAR